MLEGTTETMLRVAQSYAREGWAVIPVYGVSEAGVCRCQDGGACHNAGKHPIQKGWTKGDALSGADVYAVWGEDYPGANVGLRTGEISGFFVLDVEADGLDELAALVALNGPLPATFTVATGGGGSHHYFAMPDFPIRNNAKKLAPHIDIRGTGGQVVAPPSVSSKGQYTVVDRSPVAAAPAWLLEMLRAPSDAPDITDSAVIEELPRYDSLDTEDQERAQRYALTVLEDEARQYVAAPPGSGNQQLFQSACNVLEIIQSPWNTYTVGDAYSKLDEARLARAATHQYGGGQTADEFAKTFQSARGKVIGQGRELPPGRYESLAFDPGPGFESITAPSSTEQPATEYRAKTPLERLRSRLHNRSALAGIQPPTPLIEGVIDVGTMVVLAGGWGTFKTFVSVGWACSVATGHEWMGHQVTTPGVVLYVAAEGASGIQKRVTAWEQASGVQVPDEKLWVVDIPVNLVSDEWCSALLEIGRELGATVIILDTLHRCSAGLDEDKSTDMGRVTAVADALREHLGATTVFVHHTGHTGVRSRGSSSIEQDADAVWISKLPGDDSRDPKKPRVLEQRKTKDSDLLEPFNISLVINEDVDSGVLVECDERGKPMGGHVAGTEDFNQPSPLFDWAAELELERNANARMILDVIRTELAEHQDFTEAGVKSVCAARYGRKPGWGTGSMPKTFARGWGRLQKAYAIEQTTGQRWRYVPVSDRPTPAEGSNALDE